MDRRNFLKITAAAAVAVAASPVVKAGTLGDILEAPVSEDSADKAEGKLITSAPMLQNFAETSIGIAFAVSDNANGYVRIADNPSMDGARLVKCGGYRFTDMNPDVMLVRVTGLKPSTRYYYTIGADRISYKGGYKMAITGNEEDSRVYSFTTAGKDAKAHFCVINDTHRTWETFAALTDRIHEKKPSCVIWNGDATKSSETINVLKESFLQPPVDRKDFASETPFLLCPGNHESRGLAARHLERVWMFRQNEERSSRDWDLGRNFAVRLGDVALIGLDTSEDRQDNYPSYAGLFNNGAYWEAQTVWLADALKRKDIASAPFKIAFCHIPLSDSDPAHDPGCITADNKEADFGRWQWHCNKMWGPLLSKAGCKLVVSGHTHVYRYDEPEGNRKWGQLVGGSPRIADMERPATIIEGYTQGHELIVRTLRLLDGKVLNELSFRK